MALVAFTAGVIVASTFSRIDPSSMCLTQISYSHQILLSNLIHIVMLLFSRRILHLFADCINLTAKIIAEGEEAVEDDRSPQIDSSLEARLIRGDQRSIL